MFVFLVANLIKPKKIKKKDHLPKIIGNIGTFMKNLYCLPILHKQLIFKDDNITTKHSNRHN